MVNVHRMVPTSPLWWWLTRRNEQGSPRAEAQPAAVSRSKNDKKNTNCRRNRYCSALAPDRDFAAIEGTNSP
jgi:hypothetical protein